ncbi:MAG: hypothetical protein L3K24_11355 [Gammaproteobacteria bacterium]|nr:hypothetical protein [Gammaproteobacteria bacterium]
MSAKSIVAGFSIFLASCANISPQNNKITDVYVADFGSEDIQRCRPSDVDLSHSEAREFFLKAREVDYKIVHDYYNYAPCYIEGTLKYKSINCEWEIRAGATGQIKCGQNTNYFVCDTCEDLFKSN